MGEVDMKAWWMIGALVASPAWARPVVLPVQGQLTDAGGAPVDGVAGITFRMYGDPTSALTLHEEHLTVELLQGAFTVYLGSGDLLDSTLFELDQDVWLGIQIDGDVEMELVRVGWTPLAAYAAHASNAETLDGYGSADFLGADWRPSWTDLTDRPPGLDDGDDVGGAPWTVGAGLALTGDELSVDPAAVYGWAQQVCYDSVEELRGSLDGVYLGAGWRPAWGDLTGVPAGFADGVDDDTRYTAGDGVLLTGTTLSADWGAVEARARAVAYDQPSELHDALDGSYKPAGYQPGWVELTGVPAGFADGVDDGGPAYTAGDGIVIQGTTISTAPASIDTPEEVVAAVAPTYVDDDELAAALAAHDAANDARVQQLDDQLQAALDAIAALTQRVQTVEGTTAGLDTRVGAVEGTTSALGGRVGAVEATTAALDGRVGEVEDRTAELQAAYDRLAADHAALEAAHAQLQADYAALEARVAEVEDSAVWYIGESVTYDIPGDFGSLDEAMSWLARYRISTDAIVTLQLGPGTHTMTETLVVQHPNAQNIEIVGNVAAPASVVLEAAPGSAAEGGLIHAGHGVYLGAVRGLTLASSNTGAGNAMLAFENGGIGVAEKVRVEGFVYGAQATTSGTIVAPGIVTDGTGYGLLASHGGYLRADDARVVMAGTDVGVGLYAVDGGVLVSIGGRSTNGQYGALATRNSLVHADDAIFTAPSKFGVYAQYGSHVRVDGATVTGMGSDSTYGYLAQFNASVSAGSSTLSSPVTWGYRAAYTSSIAAAYAIANRADVYNTFAADYGSSVYVPYATGRATHLGYYAQASSINAFNSSSSGGDYGYYAYGNAFLEASDSVASGAGSYGFYSGYSSIVDRSGGSGTALPAAASTAGANSNNFYSYVR